MLNNYDYKQVYKHYIINIYDYKQVCKHYTLPALLNHEKKYIGSFEALMTSATRVELANLIDKRT